MRNEEEQRLVVVVVLRTMKDGTFLYTHIKYIR